MKKATVLNFAEQGCGSSRKEFGGSTQKQKVRNFVIIANCLGFSENWKHNFLYNKNAAFWLMAIKSRNVVNGKGGYEETICRLLCQKRILAKKAEEPPVLPSDQNFEVAMNKHLYQTLMIKKLEFHVGGLIHKVSALESVVTSLSGLMEHVKRVERCLTVLDELQLICSFVDHFFLFHCQLPQLCSYSTAI